MEKNNLNKAYIYIIAVFAIGIAVSNIISFFNGVGFALIGASLLLVLAITNIFKDDAIKNRFIDIFMLVTIELIMLIILFFAYDFNINGITNDFPLVMRNICAIYSLIATIYVLFRYISEIKGKKYNFVERMLGNLPTDPNSKKKSKEEIKKNKELENGTLEPKPSSLEHNSIEPVIDEEVVDVPTDELNTENVVNKIEEANEVADEQSQVEKDTQSSTQDEVQVSAQNENQNTNSTTVQTERTPQSSTSNRFWY